MPRPFGYRVSNKTKKKISETRKRLGLKPEPYERNPDIKLVCKICGKEYDVIYSRKDKSKYCSNKCSKESLKGRKPWNTGKFKANSYGAYHYRVRKTRGNTNKCEECGTTSAKKYDWASLKGKYEDINDYKHLCVSCHNKLDGKIRNITGRRCDF